MAKKSGELSVENANTMSASTRSDSSIERYAADAYLDSEREELEANVGEAPAETEHIKAQIEETRHQMGETIDAIQERLSFSNISEQVSETVSNAIETAKDTAYDATIGKAVNFMKNVGEGVSHSDTFKTMKRNPFPLALIGLGTGLMVYQSMNRRGSMRRGNGHSRARMYRSGDRDQESFGKMTERAYDGITDKANSAYESVSNVAGSAYDSVTGAMNSAYTGAGDVAHRVYDRAGEFGTMAHEKYDEYLEENPLALGAIAIAVGAAVGMSIPSTKYEGRMMGEARENLMQRAQDAAGSLVDKAKQAATEVGQTIKEETQSLTQ